MSILYILVFMYKLKCEYYLLLVICIYLFYNEFKLKIKLFWS